MTHFKNSPGFGFEGDFEIIIDIVPNTEKNHDAMLQLESQLTGLFRKHGILPSYNLVISRLSSVSRASPKQSPPTKTVRRSGLS